MRAKAGFTGLLSRTLRMSWRRVRRSLMMMRGYVGWICVLTVMAAVALTRACTSGKCLHQGSRVFYRTNKTPIWSDAEVFIGGDTMAEIRQDLGKFSCRLTVIQFVPRFYQPMSYRPCSTPRRTESRKELISNLTIFSDEGDRVEVSNAFPNASQISLGEMMLLIEKCGAAEEFLKERSWSAKKLAMYPGTLWCGPGDYASNYSHLGENKEIDRCCRNHDFCPTKIYAGRTRFGLKPPFLRAALLCECERAFDQCLRKLELEREDPSPIRHYYFDLLDPPCIFHNSEGNYSLVSFETYNATEDATVR